MSAQTQTADDDSTEMLTTREDVAEKLAERGVLTRDDLREMCRANDIQYGSMTKAEMGEALAEDALEAAVGRLAEEGINAEPITADEDEDEDNERQTVEDVLARDPDEHYNDSAITGTEKQVAALKAALDNPHLTEDEVAELAGCTGRYVYDACARWSGSEDEQEMVEDAGADTIPDWAQEVAE